MLKPISDYIPEIKKFCSSTIIENEEKYKFYNFTSWWNGEEVPTDISEWNTISRVSVGDDKVLGYMSADIVRDTLNVSTLRVINFNLNTISLTFVKDIKKFIDYLFSVRKFNKLEFKVAVGNPAEKLYDKFIEKYNGRVVGTYTSHIKLIDGKYYDVKLYEVMNPLKVGDNK